MPTKPGGHPQIPSQITRKSVHSWIAFRAGVRNYVWNQVKHLLPGPVSDYHLLVIRISSLRAES